jgi:hypothetical protein
MADEPTSGAAPAAASVTTPAPAATITSPDALAADGNTDTISIEAARKLRSEAEAMRKRLKAYEAAEEAAKLAALSETEKLNKQHADLQAKHDALEQKYRERVISAEVQLAAAELGIVHPEKVFRLIDTKELEYEEDGTTPKNAKALVEKLLKEMPELTGEKQAPPSATQQKAPMIPVGNPGPSGRSDIPSPNGMPGGRIPRITDLTWKT